MIYLNDAPKLEIHVCSVLWLNIAFMSNGSTELLTYRHVFLYRYYTAAPLNVIYHLPNFRQVQLYHNMASWLSIMNLNVSSMIYTDNVQLQGDPGNEIGHITLWIHLNHWCEGYEVNKMIRLISEILSAYTWKLSALDIRVPNIPIGGVLSVHIVRLFRISRSMRFSHARFLRVRRWW